MAVVRGAEEGVINDLFANSCVRSAFDTVVTITRNPRRVISIR